MEFNILYAIPRSAAMDSFFLALTKIAGSYGQLWVIVAALLLIFKKTRKNIINIRRNRKIQFFR